MPAASLVAALTSPRTMLRRFRPYGHATGSVFDLYMPLIHGAAILPNARWKASVVVESIARYGGTYCITVGTHVFDLLALEQGTEPLLKSMRLMVSGAGPGSFVRIGGAAFWLSRGARLRFVGVSGPCAGTSKRSRGGAATKRGCAVSWPRIPDHRAGHDQPMPLGQVGEYVCRGSIVVHGLSRAAGADASERHGRWLSIAPAI